MSILKLKLKSIALFAFIITCIPAFSQSIYLTTSGGNFGTEKWVSITTGANGTGTVVWAQGNGTYGNGQGLVSDVQIDVSAFCGQTLYINAYDRYDDSWDGTIYEIWTQAGQSGTLLANNGNVTPDSGDDDDCNTSDWCTSDPASELEVSEAFAAPACPCTFPVANYTIQPDCGNAQFSILVNVTSTGDGTGVDITDGTTTYFTNVGTGNYTVGPFTAGSNQTISVEANLYGGCDINSANLTEACACTTIPVATVSSGNLNCTTSTYDIDVTVTNDGDGTVNLSDILIDGAVVQANATTGLNYTFNVPVGSHTVTIESEGGAFVSCTSIPYVENLLCTPDICSDAIDILGSLTTVDLTVANNDAGETDGVGEPNFISMGNGTTLSNCGSGPQHSAYYYTDYTDLWYVIDIPDGSDEFSVTFTGLTCPIVVLPYTGTCGSLSLMNIGTSGAGGIVDADFDASIEANNGDEPFIDTDGSIHFKGADVAAASTGQIYLRIMPHDNQASGTNCNPADITYCSFNIIATSPQPNDVCGDALPIINPTTFAPQTQTGNIALSNIDAETSPNSNGTSCDGPTMATSEEDLWYSITTPPTGGNYFLEVDIDFTGPEDVLYVVLEEFCASGTVIGCSEISADGTIVFDSNNITNFDQALNDGSTYNIKVVLPTGSTANNFSITGRLVAENNTCEVMQNVFPGFDIATFTDANFNFATASGAQPAIAGNDLWFQFDPVTGTDGLMNVSSSSVDIQIGGLTGDQELTLALYKGNTVSSNNCNDLASDYMTTVVAGGNGTFIINCLDVEHSPADGGYILRVIQTAGSSVADNVSIQAFPNPPGPYNNDCDNIWNAATNSPAILHSGYGAANFFNGWYIPNGTFLADDFEDATDCHPDITSATCNGLDHTVSASNNRDLWFIFQVPGNDCGTLGLTQSSLVTSMDLTYNAGNAFRDAVMYVYSGCTDADLIDCSGIVDGAGETWTVNGLTQGEFYLLRVKPSFLNSTTEYSFDITVEEGDKRPCNDDGDAAEPMTVESCNDYDNLPTWSMQGASESPSTGVPQNDVWFTFTAPNPANGGDYFVANRSWVTVFLEHVSGASAAPISIQLYNSPTSIVATANTFTGSTTAGSQTWAHFGHLIPGKQYYLRVYHNDLPSVDVRYKLNVYTPDANASAWECGENGASLTSGCSEGCEDLREAWFKIDLPEGTPSNQFYMIEVVGEDQLLDFELRSQYISESSATEGDIDDFDLPCSSRPLEPGVSMVMETTGITTPTDGGNCNPNGIAADGGQGVRRVYQGMNGPAAGQKDYYYVKVFMDPSDPNYATTTGLNICKINFNGPYSTALLADAGGATDISCLPSPLSVELMSFEGFHSNGVNELRWSTSSEMNNSHFVVEASYDGEHFYSIGQVNGNGTTNEVSNYQFTDSHVSRQLMYYRIIQIDFDGTSTRSKELSIIKDQEQTIAYPNPVKLGQQFTINSASKFNHYTVTDLSGKIVSDHTITRTNSMTIETIDLKKGVYLIQLNTEFTTETIRMVVN